MLSIILPAHGMLDPDREKVKQSLNGLHHEVLVQYDPLCEGKGKTLREGFKRCKGDWIVWLDVDMEIHPKHIKIMVWDMHRTNADVGIASKMHPLSYVDYPPARLVLSRVGYWIIKTLIGLTLKDTQTGLKIFKREVLEQEWKVDGFGHDVEVLLSAHRRGYKIIECPVRIEKKLKGSVTIMSILRTLKEIIWLKVNLK